MFHRFTKFSLDTDAVANFDHALEIENIFSRVTGGTVSQIDGLIQTQGNASLFLLNPAGVIFGANAQLDIGGSLVVSTADSLIFADGTEFSAIAPEAESLLTISAPIGLQYGNAGAIEVLPNGNRAVDNDGLNINPGNTLALLGGDISITRNSLNTVGSNTEIASVESGVVTLKPDDLGWQFSYQNDGEFGVIDFNDRALINSSGRVNFRGKTINFSAGAGILDFNQLDETRSTINLTATESINLDGGLLITQVGVTSNSIKEAIADAGGDIMLEAPQVSVSNDSIISAGTLSEGTGGNITINAQDWVKLSSEEGKNPAIISTSTDGNGQGGQININTGKLMIESGSQIQALAGSGSGGTITVNASESVDLSGTGILRSKDSEQNISETELASGFFASSGTDDSSTEEQPQGESGSLVINSPQLTIAEGAQISVSNFGSADAGDIKITTSSLHLDNASQIVANTASSEGGSIDIFAEDLILLNHGSSISTTAEQNGNGGNITLKTANLALIDSSQVNANANQGNGGNIFIDTQGLFIDRSSGISASSQVDQKQGNVEISTLDLNSRLATDYTEQSSLMEQEQITSGCGIGANLKSNQLRDVGRGGIPPSPLRENTDLTTLSDWGTDETDISNSNSTYINRKTTVPSPAIVEAGRWIINSQGVVELVANIPLYVPLSSCPINRS